MTSWKRSVSPCPVLALLSNILQYSLSHFIHLFSITLYLSMCLSSSHLFFYSLSLLSIYSSFLFFLLLVFCSFMVKCSFSSLLRFFFPSFIYLPLFTILCFYLAGQAVGNISYFVHYRINWISWLKLIGLYSNLAPLHLSLLNCISVIFYKTHFDQNSSRFRIKHYGSTS